APASMTNSTPVLFSTESAPGAIATRRSPGADSATIPAVIATALEQGRGGGEEKQLDGRGFGRGRATNAISLDVCGATVADGPFGGLLGVSGAHHFAQAQDRVLALERHHDDGAFGHKLDQAGEEGALFVYFVEAARLCFGEARHAQRQHLEAGLLDHSED